MAAELPGVQGAVRYGPLSPLRTDIMGPFRFLPMQCSHSVYSMAHTLAGGFTVDGRFIDLTGGTGYIEGDRGSAFPRDYLWVQCNDFAQPCSVMASVAHIPFCGRSFTGCICAVVYRGREYRLATYRGVRIVEASVPQACAAAGQVSAGSVLRGAGGTSAARAPNRRHDADHP